MRKIVILYLLCLVWCAGFAQQKINGVVFEAETMEPLIGAAVMVKGTTTGQTTDLDGKFSIMASVGETLFGNGDAGHTGKKRYVGSGR